MAAGKDETVNITVNKEVFKSYDALTAKTYVMDAGKYYLAAGTDAHDALNNLLALKGFSPENTENRMTAAGNKDLAAVALQLEGTDTVTYSKSVETGVKITNQFDFADINLYETADLIKLLIFRVRIGKVRGRRVKWNLMLQARR